MKLYRRSDDDPGDILDKGFRDVDEDGGSAGVWFSRQRLDGDPRMKGDFLYEVEMGLPDEELAAFEQKQQGYVAFLIPAQLLSKNMRGLDFWARCPKCNEFVVGSGFEQHMRRHDIQR